ncbi:MAG: polysaccharide deacetylase family protein [Niabella sp.]
MYFVKTPFWLKKLFNAYTWDIKTSEKILYLTFDDGPHPVATPFVLNELDKYNAKATFFCLGKNVIQHPDIYKELLLKGHAVGNHTHNHLNGWKVNVSDYIANVREASRYIQSSFFRPPYGRISKKQGQALKKDQYSIIMWDVLSGDFNLKLSPENCLKNVTLKAAPGSVVVFHDSQKAFKNLSYALPKILEYFDNWGFIFNPIETGVIVT